MRDLPLTYAGLLYLDRTLPLLTGEVAPAGISLGYQQFPTVIDLFRTQARSARFPISEMSLGTFAAMRSRGDDRFVGLPIFISRHFRHRHVYLRGGERPSGPADLVGRVIGVSEYQMTAAVWMRGILQHEHGVHPEQIEWVSGGLRDIGYVERYPIGLPEGIRMRHLSADDTLEDALRDGRIDGLMTAKEPTWFGTVPGVHRVFEDWYAAERDYYARTGIFPPMHLVALRRDVYDRHPWVARALYDAFVAAKQLGAQRLRFQASLPVGLPWLQRSIDEVDADFGGDAFPYGVARNRTAVETFLGFAWEQGIIARQMSIPELIAAELLDT